MKSLCPVADAVECIALHAAASSGRKGFLRSGLLSPKTAAGESARGSILDPPDASWQVTPIQPLTCLGSGFESRAAHQHHTRRPARPAEGCHEGHPRPRNPGCFFPRPLTARARAEESRDVVGAYLGEVDEIAGCRERGSIGGSTANARATARATRGSAAKSGCSRAPASVFHGTRPSSRCRQEPRRSAAGRSTLNGVGKRGAWWPNPDSLRARRPDADASRPASERSARTHTPPCACARGAQPSRRTNASRPSTT